MFLRAAHTRTLPPADMPADIANFHIPHTSSFSAPSHPLLLCLMQMQVGEQTAGQVEERLEEEEEEREEEESSSAPSEPQSPMEVYKTAIYR